MPGWSGSSVGGPWCDPRRLVGPVLLIRAGRTTISTSEGDIAALAISFWGTEDYDALRFGRGTLGGERDWSIAKGTLDFLVVGEDDRGWNDRR
jgi:hypothetical protein